MVIINAGSEIKATMMIIITMEADWLNVTAEYPFSVWLCTNHVSA